MIRTDCPPLSGERLERTAGRLGAFTAALVTSLCLLSASTPAAGQSYVQPPCIASKAPAFVDALQPLWYRRFWTGECKDLPGLQCRRGKPNWNDVVRTLTARAPAGKRVEAAARACRLGRQIGFEWTLPRAVRRIDTHDLKALNAQLEQAPDVMAGLTAVEAQVRAKVRR